MAYKKPKIHDIKKHAIEQLKERFNIKLSESDYNRICKYISKAPSDIFIWEDGTTIEYLDKQTNKNHVFKLNWNNESIVVIYDKKRKSIVTFLPKEVQSVNDIEYKKYKELYDGIEDFN